MDPTTAALEKEHEAVSLVLSDGSACPSLLHSHGCSLILSHFCCNARLFSFVLLDHQSEVCGQNPDREL